jgi:hypothetical protein
MLSPLHALRLLSLSLYCALSLTLASCSVVRNIEQIDKSTAEVGKKIDKTTDGIDESKQKIEDANKKVDETNTKLEDTNTNMRETNQRLEDVHQKLNEMNNQLSQATQRIEMMNRALERMYQVLRQGDSLTVRLNTIDKMNSTSQLNGKIVFAAQYFMSFEYQLWKGEGSDDELLRQLLIKTAVDEFIQLSRRFVPSDFALNVLDENHDLLSLKALALALHVVNENTQSELLGKKQQIPSMLDLLKSALTFGRQLDLSQTTITEIPQYAKVALTAPDLIQYLLEIRVMMFPAVFVGSLSDIDSDSFLSRWFSRAGLFMRPWTVQIDTLNQIQLKEFCQWMALANVDKEFLQALGMTPRVDEKIVRILRNLHFSQAQSPTSPESVLLSKAQLVQQLKTEIERYLAP